MSDAIAIVLKGYPRLSETFIAQEILGLERTGLDIHLYSLRFPTDKARHPVHDEIIAPVTYLPEYLHQEPGRILRAAMKACAFPGFVKTLGIFLKDLARDRSRNRIRRFGQAMVLASELHPSITHLHAHFLHTPTSVTRYAALMRKMKWTCSAHAKDIWTSPEWELSEKLDSAAWTVTCTASGHKYLQSLSTRPDHAYLSYHGLDLNRFPPSPTKPSKRDGSDPENPVRIVSVGRAVPKKGYDLLMDALAALPSHLHWQFTHIGGGELLSKLERQADRLNIADRVQFLGALPQVEVLELYRASDLFVLPCRITADGDRDGLPNVLVEAASQRLACISTEISGIPEFFHTEENGILVPPEDSAAVSEAIKRLIMDPKLRGTLGKAAEERARTEFDFAASVTFLAEKFAETFNTPDGAGARS